LAPEGSAPCPFSPRDAPNTSQQLLPLGARPYNAAAGLVRQPHVETHLKAQEKSEFLPSGLAKDGAKGCDEKVICHYLAGHINDKGDKV